MKKNIIALLECTLEEYNERKFQTYWNWCMSNSNSPAMTQMLLANAAVSNWFEIEHAKLEKEFLEMKFLQHRNLGFRSGVYKSCMSDIFGKYPKPLIDACKPESNDFLTNPTPNNFLFYAN